MVNEESLCLSSRLPISLSNRTIMRRNYSKSKIKINKILRVKLYIYIYIYTNIDIDTIINIE